MQIEGKQATSLKLNCPLMCGGFVENEMLLYLLEDDTIYLFGKCGECGQSANLSISLIDLLARTPQARIM